MHSVVLGTIAFAGCGIDDSDATTAGLELVDTSSMHASGTFTRNASAISFEMTREGTVEHFVVSSADGTPLVDARINDDGSHTTQLMGGRLTVTVAGMDPPKYTGDESALEELEHLPEAAAMSELEPALVAQEVPRTLLPSKSLYPDPNVAALYEYLPCGAFAGPTQSIDCGSNFLGWTSLYVYNYSLFSEGALIWQGSWSPLYLFQAHTSGGWIVPYFGYDLSGWKWAAHTYINNPGTCPAHYWCPPGGVYNWNTYNGDAGVLFTH